MQAGVEDLPALPLDRHLRQAAPSRRAESPTDAQVGRLHLGYVACVARERRVVGVTSAVWKGGNEHEAEKQGIHRSVNSLAFVNELSDKHL